MYKLVPCAQVVSREMLIRTKRMYVRLDERKYSPKSTTPQIVLTNGRACSPTGVFSAVQRCLAMRQHPDRQN